MPEAARSLQHLLEAGTDRLRGAGLAEPRRQALRLWSDLGGSSPALQQQAALEPEKVARFEHAIARRLAGEPLPHVTGWAGFRHLSLKCDGRALIPRPETEGLLDLLLQRARTGLVADIGTGTGCIALSLATGRRLQSDRSHRSLARGVGAGTAQPRSRRCRRSGGVRLGRSLRAAGSGNVRRVDLESPISYSSRVRVIGPVGARLGTGARADEWGRRSRGDDPAPATGQSGAETRRMAGA